jgi:hypothetical protein
MAPLDACFHAVQILLRSFSSGFHPQERGEQMKNSLLTLADRRLGSAPAQSRGSISGRGRGTRRTASWQAASTR